MKISKYGRKKNSLGFSRGFTVCEKRCDLMETEISFCVLSKPFNSVNKPFWFFKGRKWLDDVIETTEETLDLGLLHQRGEKTHLQTLTSVPTHPVPELISSTFGDTRERPISSFR